MCKMAPLAKGIHYVKERFFLFTFNQFAHFVTHAKNNY